MNFFKKILDSMVRARQMQAAYHTAQHLIASNKDFKHMSVGELVNRIMDEDNPVYLDGSPVKKRQQA